MVIPVLIKVLLGILLLIVSYSCYAFFMDVLIKEKYLLYKGLNWLQKAALFIFAIPIALSVIIYGLIYRLLEYCLEAK